MKISIKLSACIAATILSAQSVALPFTEVRIGDIDGFGYDVLSVANFATVIGTNDSNGSLGVADQLPSLGESSGVLTGSKDDFDNRLNEGYSISGGSLGSMGGAEYTDISLSTSYVTSQNNSEVYNANTNSKSAGGTFPDPTVAVPNQPGFVFDFTVAMVDISSCNDLFFNMLFGDYDVNPASITFNFDTAAEKNLGISTQPSALDGLIQAAFLTLGFDDAFTADGLNYHGYLEVDFIADREPYTAFDFVELSPQAISTSVPEPAHLLLLVLGLLGMCFKYRRTGVAD